MRINIDNFNGISPRIDDKLLQTTFAQKAENVDILSGKLVPVASPLHSYALPDGIRTSIYPYNNNWLSWTADVDVVQSPISNDPFHRIYYSGDGAPKMRAIYDNTEEEYEIGITPPENAPITGNPITPGTMTTEAISVSYVYTYVTKFGEESAPSPPSPVLDVTANTNVVLTGLTTPVPNDRAVVFIRIYRTTIGLTEDATYRFVDEINIGDVSTTYTDRIPIGSLGSAIVTTLWNKPPDDLKGLTIMAGGIMVGFVGNTLYFTEPYLPNAWNPTYELALDFDIVGIEPTSNSLVVGTTQHPYVIDGSRPEALLPIKLATSQPCLAKLGMVAIGNAVYYPGPDGMVMVQQGQALLFTKDIYSRKEWKKLSPASMIAGTWDRSIYMFFTNDTIIMDTEQRGILPTSSDEHVQGLLTYYDSMYIIQGSSILEWGRGDTFKYLTWKSAEVAVDRPVDFSVGRVIADDYPLSLRLFSKEAPDIHVTVNDDSAFRLPITHPSKFWELEVESAYKIDEISLATSMSDFRIGDFSRRKASKR